MHTGGLRDQPLRDQREKDSQDSLELPHKAKRRRTRLAPVCKPLMEVCELRRPLRSNSRFLLDLELFAPETCRPHASALSTAHGISRADQGTGDGSTQPALASLLHVKKKCTGLTLDCAGHRLGQLIATRTGKLFRAGSDASDQNSLAP